MHTDTYPTGANAGAVAILAPPEAARSSVTLRQAFGDLLLHVCDLRDQTAGGTAEPGTCEAIRQLTHFIEAAAS